MKTQSVLRILVVVGVVFAVILLGGCTSVDQLAKSGMGLIGGGGDTGTTSSSGDRDGDEDSSMGGIDPTTLTMLPPAAAFQIVYAQSALFTAAAVSVDDFLPGEGIRWELFWEDEEGASDTMYTEQAFLTTDASGEWWYIALADDEYTIEYEYFVNVDDVVTELLYRDSGMSETKRATVNVPLDRMDDDDEYGSLYERIEAGEAGDEYDVDRRSESVTVPAGTFNAEVYDVTGTDPDTGESIDTTWWRVDSVPGDTVRFEYRTDDDETYQGRLQSYRTDYRRTL